MWKMFNYTKRNQICCKIFSIKNAQDELKSLYNEYNILKKIPYHGNIVYMHYNYTHPQISDDLTNIIHLKDQLLIFLALEHSDMTLTSYLKTKNLKETKDLGEIIYICFEIGEAMLHLYDHNIIHRNINFDNIILHLINDEYYPVITNFANAVIVLSEGNQKVCWKDSYIHPEDYTAPEVQQQISEGKTKINYSKQPSWEFGMLCKKIFHDWCGENEEGNEILNGSKMQIKDIYSNLLNPDPNERYSLEAYKTFRAIFQYVLGNKVDTRGINQGNYVEYD